MGDVEEHELDGRIGHASEGQLLVATLLDEGAVAGLEGRVVQLKRPAGLHDVDESLVLLV